MEAVKSFTVSTERADIAGSTVQLLLYEDRLTVVRGGEEKRCFQLEDVIGLKLVGQTALQLAASSSNGATASSSAYTVELCTYSVTQQSSPNQRTTRNLKFIYFYFNSENLFEENKTAAQDCRDYIQRQCWENDKKMFKSVSNTSGPTTQKTKGEPPQLLIVINPFSGTKTGLKDYKESVEPLLEIAGIVVEQILITERPNHAKEFIQSFDFSRISGIVCVGGDGTLYELINGIMSRADHVHITNSIPIGVIPTGSGNGILSSLVYEQGEEYGILNAVYQIIRGGSRLIDLAKVTMATRQFHMFLSLTWGIIADIDIESEAFRFMGGELRTTIGGLKCILQKRIYKGRVSYRPIDNAGETENGKQFQSGASQNNDTLNDDLVVIVNEATPNKDQSGCERSLSTIEDSVPVSNTSEATPTKPDDSEGISLNNPSLLTAKDDWITLEDDYVTVLIGLAPKISNKLFGDPEAVLGSGHMYIMYASRQAKRMELLNAMIAMETGDHITHDIVHVVKAVKACRLQPLTTAGRIVIDGEEVEYGEVLVEMDGRMAVYSRNKITD